MDLSAQDWQPLASGHTPVVLKAAYPGCDLAQLVRRHRQTIDAALFTHGAVLFRGFAIDGIASFEGFVASLESKAMDYTYRSTPRTSVGTQIFTATEYPPSQEIPLHNENAYQRVWPLRVAFCCLTPATSGGETPIADMRRVTDTLGSDLVDEFEKCGVLYIRHYRAHIDLPWQQVFQTDDRCTLAQICKAHDLIHEWLSDGTLRTKQVCQGVAVHPKTRERLFFNQAHLFHISSLGAENAKVLIKMFGAERLPRQSFYGDGTPIASVTLERIRAAFSSQAIRFRWQAGDVLLLDNMRFAHGRCAYAGERKVLAALLDPIAAPSTTSSA